MCCRATRRRSKMGSRQLAMGSGIGDWSDYTVLPGLACLAVGDGFVSGLLPAEHSASKRRAIWTGFANPARQRFCSGKHRRRLWARQQGFVYPVLADCAGIVKGTGNALAFGKPDRYGFGSRHCAAAFKRRDVREDVAVANQVSGGFLKRLDPTSDALPTAHCRLPRSKSYPRPSSRPAQ